MAPAVGEGELTGLRTESQPSFTRGPLERMVCDRVSPIASARASLVSPCDCAPMMRSRRRSVKLSPTRESAVPIAVSRELVAEARANAASRIGSEAEPTVVSPLMTVSSGAP